MKPTKKNLGHNKFDLLRIHLSRITRASKTSYPYISGDAFSKIADVSVFAKLGVLGASIEHLTEARVIFCVSDKLDELISDFGKSIKAKVIICGNSDYNFNELPKNLPKNLKFLLVQNSFISDNNFIETLPIGLENFRIAVNGNPDRINLINSKLPSNQVLFGPFGNTHFEREIVQANFELDSDKWGYASERKNSKGYDRLVSKYKYVAAVRGNGVDTHRVWETLYRGRIPVVKLDAWSESLARLDLPIVLVDEWSESEIIRVITENKFDLFNPKLLPALWMPYWQNKILSHL